MSYNLKFDFVELPCQMVKKNVMSMFSVSLEHNMYSKYASLPSYMACTHKQHILTIPWNPLTGLGQPPLVAHKHTPNCLPV